MNKRFETKGLELLIGIPGSGKTSYCNLLSHTNLVIISSDNIRRELTGNVSDLSKDKDVWNIVESRIIAALNEYKYVVLDATNVNTKYRRLLINSITNACGEIDKYATLFLVSENEAIRRIKQDLDNKKDRSAVPNEVVKKLSEQMSETLTSIKDEGFKHISTIDSESEVCFSPKIGRNLEM